MIIPSNSEAVMYVAGKIAEYIQKPLNELIIHEEIPVGNNAIADAVIEAEPYEFIIEYKTSVSAGIITGAIQQVQRYHSIYSSQCTRNCIPLIVVPYMSRSCVEVCLNSQVCWMDLSGNARIQSRGLMILISGNPNKYVARGRPRSLFSPKSSRIPRLLLMNPNKPITQREIAHETELGEGYVSKLISRLERENYVVRQKDRSVKLLDPNLLLDAWYDAYDFNDNKTVVGYIPSRSGESLLNKLISELKRNKIGFAFTGMAAAWQMIEYAGFRSVEIYFERNLDTDFIRSLDLVEGEKGKNTTLVIKPFDKGVFLGARVWSNIRCVHPIQVWLDLKNKPERSKEVAQELRNRLLNWSNDGN